MKKISNFVLALGFAGILSVGSASAGSPVTISFDGFCDGMTLNTEGGLVGGTLAGCLTGIAMGNQGVDYGLIPLDGTSGEISNVASSGAGSSEILNYYLDFTNDTWANYGDAGDGYYSIINSGTFSISDPGAKHAFSGPPSSVRQGAARPGVIFSRTASISFDGFCDGMSLSFSGDLIAGTPTGCSSGIVAGNTGKDFSIEPFGLGQSGIAANVGSNVDGEGYLLNYYLDFANDTWANYDTTTGSPTFLRSGTFTVTAGGMAAPAAGLPSSHR